ncbi:MAG: hypothetical protein JWN50_123 [Parcubacteria group bacterium]|nr:hypothetical protein [Parcubacteria group bacterium]
MGIESSFEKNPEEALEGTIEGLASKVRESLTEEDKELLDKCDFTKASYYGDSLEGTIETGQKLSIARGISGIGREYSYRGTLDGKSLTQDECKHYIDRYNRVAQYQRAQNESENPDSHIYKSINK